MTQDTERRLIALEGAPNFRDLGGYPARDGRRTSWGKLFRSGSISQLSEADLRILAPMNVKLVCDLRTNYERNADPNTWCQSANIAYWADEQAAGFGELGRLLASGKLAADSARTAMLEGYRQMPFEQARAYTELFKRLATGETPMVINCAAGKDRTGVAVALILSALDVPRESILEDYVLTNGRLAAHGGFTKKMQVVSQALSWQPAVLTAVLGAEPDYLLAAFEAVEQRHGSLANYLRDALGVDHDALSRVQEHLLA